MVYLDLLLVGFGHVGREFARLLLDRSVRMRGEHGISWRVVGIATRRHGSAFDARGLDLVHALKLVDRLRVEKSVLIVPGDHFGMDGYLRIGFGCEMRQLRDGLDRLAALLRDLPAEPGGGR